MEDYQKRVVKEQDELGEKIVKLSRFLHTTPVEDFPADEENEKLLRIQLDIMQEYSYILSKRIRLFTKAAGNADYE